MREAAYIKYLEQVVLSLLAERDLSYISPVSQIDENGQKTGITYSIYNIRECIKQHQAKRSEP